MTQQVNGIEHETRAHPENKTCLRGVMTGFRFCVANIGMIIIYMITTIPNGGYFKLGSWESLPLRNDSQTKPMLTTVAKTKEQAHEADQSEF